MSQLIGQLVQWQFGGDGERFWHDAFDVVVAVRDGHILVDVAVVDDVVTRRGDVHLRKVELSLNSSSFSKFHHLDKTTWIYVCVQAHLGKEGSYSIGRFIDPDQAVHFLRVYMPHSIFEGRVQLDTSIRLFDFALFDSERLTAVAREHGHQSVEHDRCLKKRRY